MKRFLSIVLCFTMLFTLGSGALATDGDAQRGELVCGLEEHTHGPECYEQTQGDTLEESEPVMESVPEIDPETGEETIVETVVSEGHTHSASCYETVETLVCGLEEHTHGPACYAVEEEQPENVLRAPRGNGNSQQELDIGQYHIKESDLSAFREACAEANGMDPAVMEDFNVTAVRFYFGKNWTPSTWLPGENIWRADVSGILHYAHQPEDLTSVQLRFYRTWKPKTLYVSIPADKLNIEQFAAHGSTINDFAQVSLKDGSQGEIPEHTMYNVVIHYNNGEENATLQVAENDTVPTLETPQYDGYTFTGWYADEDCTTEFDFATEIESDTDIYAGWEKNGSGQQQGEKLNITFKICNNSEHGHGEGHFSHTGESTIHSNSSVNKVWLKDGVLYTDEECTKEYEYEQTVQNGKGDKKKYQLCGCDFTLSKSENQVYIYYKEDTGEVSQQGEYAYAHIFYLGDGQQVIFDQNGQQINESAEVKTQAGEHTLHALSAMPKGYEDFVLEHISIKYGENDSRNDPNITGKTSHTFEVGSAEADWPTITFIYKQKEIGTEEKVNWYINLGGQILNAGSMVSDAELTPVADFTGKLASSDQTITVNQSKWAEKYESAYNTTDAVDGKGGLVGNDRESASTIDATIRQFMRAFVTSYPTDEAIFSAIKSEIIDDDKQIYTVNGALGLLYHPVVCGEVGRRPVAYRRRAGGKAGCHKIYRALRMGKFPRYQSAL